MIANKDIEEVESDKHTANVVKNVANTILSIFKQKEDCPSNHVDREMPILDLKVSICNKEEGSRICHKFFKKPMATKELVTKDTAMPTFQKKSILIEEGRRRIKNFNLSTDWSEKMEEIRNFNRQMKKDNHTEKFRIEVTEKVIDKIKVEMENDEKVIKKILQK